MHICSHTHIHRLAVMNNKEKEYTLVYIDTCINKHNYFLKFCLKKSMYIYIKLCIMYTTLMICYLIMLNLRI